MGYGDLTTALRTERDRLATEMDNLDTDAFPGSKAWTRYNNAVKALAAFDAAHPEVIAAIKAERDGGEGVARALRGED